MLTEKWMMGAAEAKRLQRSHDEMASFLYRLLEFSDSKGSARRPKIVQKHYDEALRLVTQAGLKYKPRGEKK